MCLRSFFKIILILQLIVLNKSTFNLCVETNLNWALANFVLTILLLYLRVCVDLDYCDYYLIKFL